MNASAHKAVVNSVSLPNTFMTKVTNLRSWMERDRSNAECTRGVLICCITSMFSFWCKIQCNSRLQTLLGTVDFMTTDLNSREDLRVQILVMSCRHFKGLGCSNGSKLPVSGTNTCLRMSGKFLYRTCWINRVRLALHQIPENLHEICSLDVCQFWLREDNLNVHEI